MNTYDVKKVMRDAYCVKTKPILITLPKATYLKIEGVGDPNEKDGAYAKAVSKLYGIQYTIKMSVKKQWEIPGYYPFVVAPLEGLWWMEDHQPMSLTHKEQMHWYSIMRLPDFVSEEIVKEACRRYEQKHPDISCADISFWEWEEGICVQMLHIGSYDDEPQTIAKMHAFAQEAGYRVAINETIQRFHHEIYLSDPNRVCEEKRKTILRLPIIKQEVEE